MAGVFDRPMFQRGGPHTVARDRLKKMGNIQDYASEGMFGTGGTMEDTGFRYQQPLGYGEGQVDPGILGAVRQRDMRGSQIVQGGDLTAQDVPMLIEQRKAAMQSIKDAQLSGDPNKYKAIDQLKSKILDIDQMIEVASKITEMQDVSARDFFGGRSRYSERSSERSSAAGINFEPSSLSPAETDIFQSLSERAAVNALPDPVPPGPSNMEVDARSDMEVDARGQSTRTFMNGEPLTKENIPAFKAYLASISPEAAAKAAAGSRTTMEADARDRKPIMATSPADVAAGLNDPKPEVREKTAADFAKQFSDMSTKYEGLDKGLMLAQIGFAIAAGESPNAMKNIADGLSAGAGMMIQEKQAKNEFDRQIQLAAMQYGLGEAGKLETEKRAMAREGKAGNFFFANEDVTFGGRKYSAGDNVFVSNSQLWEGGLPAGLSTESSYSAFQTAQATVQKALIEAEKNNVLKGDEYKMVMTAVNDAADSYGQAAKMLPILEASLIRVANGEVTGFVPALQTAFNQAANAFGLKPPSEYESREQYIADLEAVTVKMIGDILGEGGKTISDNDRKIATQITATLNDIKSGLISDPNIVVSKIQDLMKTLEGNQRRAFELYSNYMKDYGSTTTMSGAPFGSIYADRIFQTPILDYRMGDDGIMRIFTKEDR